MAFATTQIWQHAKSGEWFLVRVDADREVLYTNGPLPRSDAEYTVNEAGGEFDGTNEDNDWIAAQEWRVVYP